MSIERTGIIPVQPQTTGTESTRAAERGTVGAAGADSTAQSQPTGTRADTLTLTPQATQLKAAEASLGSQSVIDGGRVESLRSAIDAGSYKINPLNVAEKLIQFERGFFEGPASGNATGTLRS